MSPVVTNAESCKRYRESRKHDPEWSERQREQTRERTRRYRERLRGTVAPVLSPVVASKCEPVAERSPLDDLADLVATGIIDREPEPDDPLARVRWKHWRDIREKELAEGRSIFQGTCPEDLERYRLRFGLDLLDLLSE